MSGCAVATPAHPALSQCAWSSRTDACRTYLEMKEEGTEAWDPSTKQEKGNMVRVGASARCLPHSSQAANKTQQ